MTIEARQLPGPAGELLWVLRPDQETPERDLERLRELTSQLQHALAARITIEQAKGVLMARKGIDEAASFELLRTLARSSQRRAADVAADLLADRLNP